MRAVAGGDSTYAWGPAEQLLIGQPSPWQNWQQGRDAFPLRKQTIPERKRATGFEPATSSLGSWHSTAELRPRRMGPPGPEIARPTAPVTLPTHHSQPSSLLQRISCPDRPR